MEYKEGKLEMILYLLKNMGRSVCFLTSQSNSHVNFYVFI